MLLASVIIMSTDKIAFFQIGPSAASGRLQISLSSLAQLLAKEIDGNGGYCLCKGPQRLRANGF
jgi:hypothetical protein